MHLWLMLAWAIWWLDMGAASYLYTYNFPDTTEITLGVSVLFIQWCPCLLAANASVFALEQTMPSSLLPPLQQFVFRPDPLHQTEPLSSKRWFPPPISSLFKNIQQRFRFRCPISYSSLTGSGSRFSSGLQHKYYGAWKCTVIGNSSNYPLLESWDTLEQPRLYSCSLTPLLNLVTCRKTLFMYTYVALFQCQTCVCLTDVWKILLFLSLLIGNFLFIYYMQKDFLMLAVLIAWALPLLSSSLLSSPPLFSPPLSSPPLPFLSRSYVLPHQEPRWLFSAC